jgi:thiamine biosynthesis lipoprotein
MLVGRQGRVRRQLINRQPINRHLINRQPINRHLINRHLINRHLINRHLINRHLINRYLINRHGGANPFESVGTAPFASTRLAPTDGGTGCR